MNQKQVDPEELVKQILNNVKESFEELKEKYNWQLGIGEAGRGLVIGPMMYAACYWPIKYHTLISDACKFADPKQINEFARQKLFDLILKLQNKVLAFETRELSAEYLSKNQLAFFPTNLNDISHDTAAELIKSAINKGFRITQIFVNIVGPKSTYHHFLQGKLYEMGKVANIVVEPKADSKYANVSAASICAKVTRYYKISQIQQEITPNNSIGSGNPSDPKTKSYLEHTNIPIFVYPNHIRFSWQTIKTLINNRNLNIDYKEEQEASKLLLIINQSSFQSQNKSTNYNFRTLAISNCIL